MTTLYESDVEKLAIALLEKQGYSHISPEQQSTEREKTSDVVLYGRLTAALESPQTAPDRPNPFSFRCFNRRSITPPSAS